MAKKHTSVTPSGSGKWQSKKSLAKYQRKRTRKNAIAAKSRTRK